MKTVCQVYSFAVAHQTLIMYILMAMAFSLPAPGDSRPFRQKIYGFFYDTAHALANRGKPTPSQPQLPTGGNEK